MAAIGEQYLRLDVIDHGVAAGAIWGGIAGAAQDVGGGWCGDQRSIDGRRPFRCPENLVQRGVLWERLPTLPPAGPTVSPGV
jgi:hypothetical protein